MANRSLKYPDHRRWVNGVEKTRADSQLEFVDTLSNVVDGMNGGAMAPGTVRIGMLAKPADALACRSIDDERKA